MAIQFARCEYVSRSKGGNACRKASYNQRSEIRCERTGELFSFKDREGHAYHEILLPEGVHEKFRNSSILWNEAERCEKRKDSQVQKEIVLALPDDQQITLEDRIELTRRFVLTHFVEKGLGVQVDIHEPDPSDEQEKNWHAHLLITTRRFSKDELGLEKAKARDLDPVIRKGTVIEADVWGEHWRDLQNAYFEEKGYEIRVDPIGIVAQEHLGPVRMRHHMNEALLRSQMLQQANEKLARDPESVLEALTRNKAIFSEKDIEIFLKKHIAGGAEERKQVLENVLKYKTILPLYDKDTSQKTGFFTTYAVRAEEEKLLRFVDAVAKRSVPSLSSEAIAKGIEGRALSGEQKEAYDLCVQSGQNLSLIQGRAGVGKSYLLDAVRIAHEEGGYRVLGLGPTHKVAADLRENGFKEAKTCHAFLFALKNNRKRLNPKTLVMVDEAGMLGTELSVELFHALNASGAKAIVVGDDRQLSSVERGGVFSLLTERYPSAELNEVRRQTIDWQKTVSEDLSRGDVKSAVRLLQDKERIDWEDTKEESLSELLKAWAKDNQKYPNETRLILAQRNIDVDALNQGAREILKQQGKLGELELACRTQRGKMVFAEGDRIHLTQTDKEQGIMNGTFGNIEKIDAETKMITVHLDNREKKEINPHTYNGLRHGYASTVYKAQGSTLDHIYVLHGKTTNRTTNYVALTRQTKSLSLFISKDETPTEAHLIRQMSREEGNKTSLIFDTQKDIERRNEEKTLTTSFKRGAEKILTKVKDAFHSNESFYNVEKPITETHEEITIKATKDQISPALQAIYEEMAQPAFSSGHALIIKKAFEKGLPIHGEEKAIAYWESKKGELLHSYQQNLDTVEKELNSPALSYRTNQWKDQAREWAKQDPTKVLDLINKLKDHGHDNMKQQPASEERSAKEISLQTHRQTLKESPLRDIHIKDTYLRFKSLHNILKDIPNADASFKEDLKQLGQKLIQDKEFMNFLKLSDAKGAKLIERTVQDDGRSHSIERSRGGLSL